MIEWKLYYVAFIYKSEAKISLKKTKSKQDSTEQYVCLANYDIMQT